MKLSLALTAYLFAHAAMWAPRTRVAYRERLMLFAASAGPDIEIGDLTANHVRSWLGTDRRPKTVRKYLSTVRGLARWLVAEGHLQHDFCAGVRAPRRPAPLPRALRAEQVAALLAAAPPRERVAIIVLAQTGLRVGELVEARWEHVDPYDRTLRVRGKGSRDRVVGIPEEAWQALEQWCGIRTWGPIIARHDDPTLPLRSLGHALAAIGRRAGVHRAAWDGQGTAHSLRHTAATDVLRSGANVKVVQQLLGHADLATTSRYLATLPGDVARAQEGRWYGRPVVAEGGRAASRIAPGHDNDRHDLAS